MATAPVAYQSALIESLRAASPGFTSNNPGVTMLPNPANSSLMINFLRGPRTGLANNPQAFTWPTFSPPPAPPAPPPSAGPSPSPSPPPGGSGGPIVVGPGPDVGPVTPLPRIDVVPDDGFVGPPAPGPSPDDDFVGPPAPGIVEVDPTAPSDDFVGPPAPDDDFVGPPAPGIVEVDPPLPPAPEPDDDFVGPPAPDDFVGPPAPDEDVAQTFPVPDPGPVDVVDLPPLPGEADPDPNDDFVGPLPDIFVGPLPDDFVGPMPDDFVGPMPDDFVGPMPDDFVGPPEPPEYDEIPQGEIEVGPPGSSQPARDAIDQIGDITEVDDPLDELGDIEPPIPDVLPPDVPPVSDDFVGPSAPVDDFVGPMPDDFVGPMPDDFVGPLEPEYDGIPEGEIEILPPGSSQPARDAIAQIGNITQVGDPLDELGDIDLPDVVIDAPSVPSAGDDFVGPMPDDFVGPVSDDFVGPMPDDFVGPMPEDFISTPATDGFDAGAFNEGPTLEQRLPSDWGDFSAADKIDWFNQNNVSVGELQAAGVPASEIEWMQENGYEGAAGNVPDYTNDLWGPDLGGDVTPDYTNDLWGPEEPALTDQDLFEMALFDLMAQELLTGPGGSGRPADEFNMMVER